MSDTYKVGKGRGTQTVQARQYVKDQDWSLANWIQGPVQVYRDHFRVGYEEIRAEKGDWIVKYPDHIEVQTHRVFSATAREVDE
jgi:hypothetical protein